MICPKCHYAAQEHDSDRMPGVCPACGIAYNKWREAQEPEELPRALSEEELQQRQDLREEPPVTRWQRFFHYVCFMPSDRHESAFWGHVVILALFTIWGLRFIVHGVDWNFIGGSFLHNVNLPFHEYGHVMFSPFGEFWMLLGGSLFQILLPLFPLCFFMVWRRDNFAASIMLWWSGQNFVDVSPYIADAPIRALPLTSGHADSHDWWNLLRMSGSLDSADSLATMCFLIGALVMLFSNCWGAFLLWVEFRGRTGGGSGVTTSGSLDS